MWSILFFIIAGILNAIMDTTRFCWNSSIFNKIKNYKLFKFCNPQASQGNKWKNSDPKQGEKFFGSSTFLVWTTDLWHACKALMILALVLGAVTYTVILNPLVDVILLYFVFTVSFEVFFSKVFIKK